MRLILGRPLKNAWKLLWLKLFFFHRSICTNKTISRRYQKKIGRKPMAASTLGVQNHSVVYGLVEDYQSIEMLMESVKKNKSLKRRQKPRIDNIKSSFKLIFLHNNNIYLTVQNIRSFNHPSSQTNVEFQISKWQQFRRDLVFKSLKK